MTDEDRTFTPTHAAPDAASRSSDAAPLLGAHAAPAPAHAVREPEHDPEDELFSENAPLGYAVDEPAPEATNAPEAFATPVEPVASATAPTPATVSAPLTEPMPAPIGEHAAPEAAEEPAATTAEPDGEAVAAGLDDSPATTAEIDVAAVEAKLSDPGSTQSFSPVPVDRIDTDSTYDAGTTTSLMWGARSDVGCVRTHNEDSYLVQSPLFCVSDGMGGHAAGEVASSIAVETIAKLAPHAADPARLAAAVEAANAAIIEAAANGLGKPGMGCTATCAYIEGNTVAIAHVGDSRAYLVHEGTLIKVTRDHSYVEELVDAGEITADEARVHPNRSVITRALGSDPGMYADHFQLNIEEGDRLILCSDGLSSMIPDSEIESISAQSPTAQMATDNLVDAALAAGGSDNVTVVVVDVVDDGRLREALRRRRRNVIIAVAALAAALVIAAVVTATSISNAVYLGVKDDVVAIYRGIPESPLGINLHWLIDETTVELSDLPADTQNRLAAGIPQADTDAARDTISQYRQQIDAEQTRQAAAAEAARAEDEAEAKDAAANDGGANTASAANAGATTSNSAASTDAAAASANPASAGTETLANTVAPTEGGDE